MSKKNWKKEEEKMLYSCFCYLRRLVFNQSSPVHSVSESRGGTARVTHGEGEGGRKFVSLILDFSLPTWCIFLVCLLPPVPMNGDYTEPEPASSQSSPSPNPRLWMQQFPSKLSYSRNVTSCSDVKTLICPISDPRSEAHNYAELRWA